MFNSGKFKIPSPELGFEQVPRQDPQGPLCGHRALHAHTSIAGLLGVHALPKHPQQCIVHALMMVQLQLWSQNLPPQAKLCKGVGCGLYFGWMDGAPVRSKMRAPSPIAKQDRPKYAKESSAQLILGGWWVWGPKCDFQAVAKRCIQNYAKESGAHRVLDGC